MFALGEISMFDEVTANRRRSRFMVAGFLLFTFAVAYVFVLVLGYGGVFGAVMALVIAAVSAFTAWWSSDKVALGMARAHPADPDTYARYHNLVEGLCIASGLPKPRLYVVEDPAPNAFATGRNPQNAAVAVTTGLLEKMNRVELEGVIAHELAHVKNNDTLVMTVAVTMVGMLTLLADFGLRFLWLGRGRHRRGSHDGGGLPVQAIVLILAVVLLVISPLVARALRAAVSRSRETLADFSAVEMTRYPPGLISALEKLQADTTVVNANSRATAHLWIESPLAHTADEGTHMKLNSLFDTHPPLQHRIEALREL